MAYKYKIEYNNSFSNNASVMYVFENDKFVQSFFIDKVEDINFIKDNYGYPYEEEMKDLMRSQYYQGIKEDEDRRKRNEERRNKGEDSAFMVQPYKKSYIRHLLKNHSIDEVRKRCAERNEELKQNHNYDEDINEIIGGC